MRAMCGIAASCTRFSGSLANSQECRKWLAAQPGQMANTSFAAFCSDVAEVAITLLFRSFFLISFFMCFPAPHVHPERSLWSSGAAGVGSEDCRGVMLLGKLPIQGGYMLHTCSIWTFLALISPIRSGWKVQ